MNDILIAVLGMAAMGLFWAVVLVVVNKKFHVDENPKIEQVVDCLPGANCGACGFAGCQALGEAIIEKDADPAVCPVAQDDCYEEIAEITGKEMGEKGTKMVAKLHCSGDAKNVVTRAEYCGLHTCMAEHITNGGTKACPYGCMGHGDCVNVCPFDALKMNENGLPVVDEEKCASCGKCVDACPRGLFKMLPIDQKVFVLCSSKDGGAITKKACKVGCIGCTLCAKKGDEATFKIESFLATVDYDAAQKLTDEQVDNAIAVCPQKIVSK
jgi:Na+-translocating ferredoxin:NAD+ oxidoreductase subunit B